MAIAIIFILCGIILCYVTFRGYSTSKRFTYTIGISFSLFGLCFLLFILTDNDRYAANLLGFALGSVFLGFGIYGIYVLFACSEKIQAKYVGFSSYTGTKGHTSYSPIFKYDYQGNHYRSTCFQSVGKRKITHKFIKGNSYPIYINRKKPNMSILSRRKIGLDLFLIFFGIVFLCIPTL